jgi:hypothetical protein
MIFYKKFKFSIKNNFSNFLVCFLKLFNNLARKVKFLAFIENHAKNEPKK